jgi:hypothetical protein
MGNCNFDFSLFPANIYIKHLFSSIVPTN